MKFEILLDEIIYKEQQKLNFDYVWQKTIKRRNENFYVGIALLLLGILIVIGKDNIGYLFISLAVFILSYCYRINNHYKSSKKSWDEFINSSFKEYKEDEKMSIWEMDNDFLHYKDYKIDLKLRWSTFKGYRKINETIFIDSNYGICFVLSEKEVGHKKFSQFHDLLSNKLNKTSC